MQDSLPETMSHNQPDLILHIKKFLAILTLLKTNLAKYKNDRVKLIKILGHLHYLSFTFDSFISIGSDQNISSSKNTA